MKILSILSLTTLTSLALFPSISLQGQEPVVVPEVRVWASSWKTAEPCPVCLVVPGVFTFERSETTKEPLIVFIRVDGTATAGEDYQVLPRTVEIPAGQSSVDLLVAPLDDELAEGPEVIRVQLMPPPAASTSAYRLPANGGEALIAIGDNEREAPAARLDMIGPADGAVLRTPSVVALESVVVWSEGEVQEPIDFFAGDQWIARSPGIPFLRPVIPCLPSLQRVFWTNPPAGDHVITARVPLGSDQKLESPPIRVTVLKEPALPVVSIEATSLIAEESSFPLRRLQFDGRLTISRTGPTDFSLPVFVHYSGTATPDDFRSLPPWLVSIPEGASSLDIRIEALPDDIPESIETLVATVSNCPPDTDPRMGIPCYGFDVDPAGASATIFLRDDGITRASVEVINPEEGDRFKVGSTIPIAAVAIDLLSYITRLEFFDGDRFIGESTIDFIIAPEPGTPIRFWFEWTGAEPGSHLITARAVLSESLSVTSPPVRIMVEGEANQPPEVTVVQPETGAVFPPMTSIEIIAEALDFDGMVRKVAFFANDRKIGETGWEFDQRPVAGVPQRFSFLWREPLPGNYSLTAQAVDNDDGTAVSPAVAIQVNQPAEIPFVILKAVDPFAVEPSSDAEANPATFMIRRFGGVDQDLSLRYSVGGSAENGADYEELTGWVRLPAGRESVSIVVHPLPDEEKEGVETVILRLEESSETYSNASQPDQPAYRIGYRGRGVALVRDRNWQHDLGRGRCIPLTGGFMHVCFPVTTGDYSRIEASSDLRRWETVFDGISLDGTAHFIDQHRDEFPRRFYRLELDSFSPGHSMSQ